MPKFRSLAIVAVTTSVVACSLVIDTNGIAACGPEGNLCASDAGGLPEAAGADATDAMPMDGNVTTDAPVATGYAAAVLADGPIAYLPLGETPQDLTGKRTPLYEGTVDVGRPSLVRGTTSTAIHLGGAGLVRMPGADLEVDGKKPFSIELWFKPDGPIDDNYHVLYFKQTPGDATRRGVAMYLRKDRISIERMQNGIATGVYADADGALVADAIIHYVGTYDGKQLRAWVNGVLRSASPDEHVIDPVGIDSTVGATAGYFLSVHGVVDELAFYDKALSEERIRAHYELGK